MKPMNREISIKMQRVRVFLVMALLFAVVFSAVSALVLKPAAITLNFVNSTKARGSGTLYFTAQSVQNAAFKDTHSIVFTITDTDENYDTETGLWTITLEDLLDFGTNINSLSITGIKTTEGGPAVLLQGDGTRGIIKSDSDTTLTLENLYIKGGNTENGGAVYFNGNVVLDNCVFENNTAAVNGGAVYATGDVTMTNCTFIGNTAGENGGAVYAGGDITATGCIFIENKAEAAGLAGRGGGMYANGSVELTNCKFSENSATMNGGAVFANVSFEADNSEFTKNTATYNGGAVYVRQKNADVDNCLFSENETEKNAGGGLYTFNGNVTAYVSVFLNNKGVNGGGIYASAHLYANRCVIYGNTASKGGGFYASGYTELLNTVLTGNTAEDTGGGGYTISGTYLYHCTVYGNTAKNGGGIRGYGRIYAYNSIFAENSGGHTSGAYVGEENLVSGINGVTAEAIFGVNGIHENGCIYILENGIADKTAYNFDEIIINIAEISDIVSIMDGLATDLFGVTRDWTNASYGAIIQTADILSIGVSKNPDIMRYDTGDSVGAKPFAGGTITVTYTNGATYTLDMHDARVTHDAAATLSTATAGMKTVTFTLWGKTCTLNIEVVTTVPTYAYQDPIWIDQGSHSLDRFATPNTTLTATGGSGSGAVTWRSSNTAVATIDNDGKLTLLSAGTTVVRVTKEADDTYAFAVYHEITITVVDKTALNSLIQTAVETKNTAIEGDDDGQYPAAAMQALQEAIEAAQGVAGDDAVSQAEIDAAYAALEDALAAFRAARVSKPVDPEVKEQLEEELKETETKLDEVEVGSQPGQYPQKAVDKLKEAIEKAQAVIDNPASTQEEIEQALADLDDALLEFEDSKIPLGPPTGDGRSPAAWLWCGSVSLLALGGLIWTEQKRTRRSANR